MECRVKARQRTVDRRGWGSAEALTENTKEASKTSQGPSSIPTVLSDFLSLFSLSRCMLLHTWVHITF